MEVRAVVFSTDDELILETNEYGYIHLGEFDHSLVKGQQLSVDVMETGTPAGYFPAIAVKSEIEEPRWLRVKFSQEYIQ